MLAEDLLVPVWPIWAHGWQAHPDSARWCSGVALAVWHANLEQVRGRRVASRADLSLNSSRPARCSSGAPATRAPVRYSGEVLWGAGYSLGGRGIQGGKGGGSVRGGL